MPRWVGRLEPTGGFARRPSTAPRTWPLGAELTSVAFLRRAIDPLEDQLADGHPLLPFDPQWPDVPHLQADGAAQVLRIAGRPKTRMDGGGRHVNTQTQA